jgi:hypothetical protein
MVLLGFARATNQLSPFGREWLAYAHVCACSDKGVCDRVDEFTRDSEITDLDLSLGVCEDVGRFDIYQSALP